MSCLQVTACKLVYSPPAFRAWDFQSSRSTSVYLGIRYPKIYLKWTSGTTRYQKAAPVCLFGGKGKSGNADEASPWKALENAMGNFKKDQSIESVLKQQIQKQEYYDEGSGKPPGGGGGGGSGDGFGEADEEGGWDEFAQVILATVGFIFLYIYIIEAEEVTVIAKDLVKFLFTRQKSLRLARIISDWESFFARMNEKEVEDPYWLEREIVNTTTMYDSPEKYRRILYQAYRDSKANNNEGYDDFEQ